jgi:hypothetical protein
MRRSGENNDNNTTPARQFNELDIRQIATPLDFRIQQDEPIPVSSFPILGTPYENDVTFSGTLLDEEPSDDDLLDSAVEEIEDEEEAPIFVPIVNDPIANAEPSPEQLEQERIDLAEVINISYSSLLRTQKVNVETMFRDMCIYPFLEREGINGARQTDPMTGDMPLKVETRYDEYTLLFSQWQRDMIRLGMFHSDAYKTERKKLCDCMSYIYYAFNAFTHCLSATSLSLGFYEGNPMQSTLYRNDWKEVNPSEKYQGNTRMSLFYFLTELACKKGLKKYGTDMYRQIYWTGHYTLAWQRKCSISEYISEYCNLLLHPDRVQQTIQGANRKALEEYLSICNDKTFPTLRKNMYMISFQNGVYVTNMAFAQLPHGSETPFFSQHTEFREDWHDGFFTYKQMPTKFKTYASCNFIDADMPQEVMNCPRWQDIPTPCVDKILMDQGLGPNDKLVDGYRSVYETFFFSVGRLFYSSCTLENLQFMPYLYGKTNTGKTELLRFIGSLFDWTDIGSIENRGDSKFGMSFYVHKRLLICFELKKNINLDQGLFNKILEASPVEIRAMYKPGETIKRWETMIICAGNYFPGWADPSGSFVRRVLAFFFDTAVANVDANFAQKLRTERPHFLVKCIRAYHDFVRTYWGRSIWNFAHPYFTETKRKMCALINSLAAFVKSDCVELDFQSYVPFNMFLDEYKRWCHAYKHPLVESLTIDVCIPTLGHFDVVLDQSTRRWPIASDPPIEIEDTYVVGLSLREDKLAALPRQARR